MTPVRLRPVPARRPPESGFLLVGVVLFVVVLTILGLSLFSLSGFEAQFLYASNHRSESFYAAASGIERARFVMIADQNKSAVKNNLPPGVIYAVAKQGSSFASADSTNKVNWSLTGSAGWVWIRVRSDVGGVQTTLEQRFDPSLGDSIYERLFTLSGPEGLFVRQFDDSGSAHPGNRWPQTRLNGLVRTTIPVVGGFIHDPQYWGSEVGPVDEPDLDSYWASHWAGATELPTVSGDFSFNGAYSGGSKGNPRFFKTSGVTGTGWSVDPVGGGNTIDLEVRGTVIWMVEKGIRFQKRVRVYGDGNDPLLVIVARPRDPTPQEPLTGIGFHGGLDMDDSNVMPVILVSDGRVNLEHSDGNSVDWDAYLRYLSVFAHNALVMGPEDNPGVEQHLRHRSDSPYDAPGGVVYELVHEGLLPNTVGGSFNRLDVIAGTWKETP